MRWHVYTKIVMKTYFYERTAYKLSDQPVPSCFMLIDEHFDQHFATFEDAFAHPCVIMAESICARMADLEMYAFLIEDARKRHAVDARGDEKATILTRSFFVGYLGAGRALLDAGAASLAGLYGLSLANSECTFANGDYWHQLVSIVPNVHRRYHPLRLFLTEFLRWSFETAHRIAPLTAVQQFFGRYAPRDQRFQVIDDPDANLAHLVNMPATTHWIDPLRLHDRWKPQFMSLCDKLCVDLEKHVGSTT